MTISRFTRFIALALVAGLTAACLPSEDSDAAATTGAQTDAASQIVFNVSGETVPCDGVAPMRCMLVNGKLFYDTIEGYTHKEGVAQTLKVARTRICNPDVINGCPQDAGIYQYRLLEIIK